MAQNDSTKGSSVSAFNFSGDEKLSLERRIGMLRLFNPLRCDNLHYACDLVA